MNQGIVSQSLVKLLLVTGKTQIFTAKLRLTGKLLRRMIFSDICDELEPQRMSLYCGDQRITTDAKLRKFYRNQVIRIVQKKLPLRNTPNLKRHKETLEENDRGQMSCAHQISRNSLLTQLQTALKNKKLNIQCPQCSKKWTFQQCDKICCFTKTEKALYKKNILGFSNQNKNFQLNKKLNNQQRVMQSSKPQYCKIDITLINKQKMILKGATSVTVEVLEQHLYQKKQDLLDPQHMAIYYSGQKLPKNMKIGQLVKTADQIIQLEQKKADLQDIIGLTVYANEIDQISYEKGVARMRCGHKIGRDTMTSFVKSQIKQGKFQMRCPHSIALTDSKCNAVWEFKDCKKVGVFTQTESQAFQKGINDNWIKFFAKECPKCKSIICKFDARSNKVVCPSCFYGEFCYICLNKWESSSGIFCGSEPCQQAFKYIYNSPWTRAFHLQDPKNQEENKTYMTPKNRACPHCYSLIEHSQACKHMTCKVCKKQFCWVCLGVPKNQKWPCGSAFAYCGKIAPAQMLVAI